MRMYVYYGVLPTVRQVLILLCTIDLITLSHTWAKYHPKIFSFIDNEMETGVERWRKSNMRRCLSTSLKILCKNTANV